MNYPKNHELHRQGDLVLHDADRKNLAHLMVITQAPASYGGEGNSWKYRYVFPPLCFDEGEYSTNDVSDLHAARRWKLCPLGYEVSQRLLQSNLDYIGDDLHTRCIEDMENQRQQSKRKENGQ